MQRPTSATIFAVLHIVFGTLVVLSNCCVGLMLPIMLNVDDPQVQQQLQDVPEVVVMRENPVYYYFVIGKSIIALLGAAVLVVAGLGLWRGQAWSRPASNLLAVLGILVAAVQAVMGAVYAPQSLPGNELSPEMMQMVSLLSYALGFVFLSLYPLAMLIFLNRQIVKDWLDPARPRYVDQAPIGPVIEPWDR